MFKAFLFLISIFCFAASASCQQRDTIVYYFKHNLNRDGKDILVTTIDSADYVRAILPADSGDVMPNVKEYYTNGNVKFIGKSYFDGPFYFKKATMLLTGDCVSFYPNGKRKGILHYSNGYKDGDEYLYYPTGKLFSRTKNVHGKIVFYVKSLYLDCYDPSGKLICENGRGHWTVYDDEFKNMILEGEVINGLPEGIWHGKTGEADSIKYTYQYEKGKFIRGTGIDRNGVAYPFTEENTLGMYKNSLMVFIDLINRKIKGFRGSNGEKISLKNVSVSFIIEKDGSLSHPEVLGDLDSAIKEKIAAILLRESGWMPHKYYGIPLKTKIIIPLNYETNGSYSAQHSVVSFSEFVVE
ncbi:hypothetical protein [Mucilaginibacter sp. R-33]|uniref:hypothetical protein n=1 Tax=unclassified Mucilaginibacter TaxID=2617802 RepID=UPI003CF956D6